MIFLDFEFMRHAILAAIFASALCGILGTFVVAHRMVGIAGGIAHAAYGGVGLAFLLHISPTVGALGFAGVAGAVAAWITLRFPHRADTVTGVLWATGMALGVLFVDLSPGYGADLMSYLFGSILTVTREDLVFMGSLLIITVIFLSIFYRDLLAMGYDEDFARTRGIPVSFLHTALVILISLVVVVVIRVVGLILVIALLTIPPHIAEGFTRSLKGMMALATGMALVFSLGGLGISYLCNITAGATIILLASATYMLTLILHRSRP